MRWHGRRDEPGRPVPRRPRWVDQSLTGLLTLLLGLGATVQIRETREPDALPGATQEDLLRIFDSQKTEAERLSQQVTEARARIDALSARNGDSGQALANATARAQALALLTGSVPATGPGVRVTITDPKRRVTPDLLLDAVQELRGAGAEAIQVNGVRVVTATAFTGRAGAVTVGGVDLTAPYRLLAIGPADDLRAALTGPGLPVSDVARDGGVADVVPADDVSVTALAGR